MKINKTSLKKCLEKILKINTTNLTTKQMVAILKVYLTTDVVNVKVEFIRPVYDNLKEWTENPVNEYIGRKGVVFIGKGQDKERFPKKDSIWANIFKIDKNTDRDKVIELYESYIREKIEKEGLQEELLKLEGKNLGCWCKPERCHGDVLRELIAEYKQKLK